jgi:hypothetical protein
MPVGIFELAHGSLNTEPSFEQRLGIPLTALFIEEIAAIDMDGAGEPSVRWPRLFGQILRLDKWIVCRG